MNSKEVMELVLKLGIPIYIILSVAKICAYYNQLNLPMLEYLDLSEMVVIFLNSLYVYAALFIHLAIIFFFDKRYKRATSTLIFLAFILIITFIFLSGNTRFELGNLLIVLSAMCGLYFTIVIFYSKGSIYAYLETLNKNARKIVLASFTLLVMLALSGFQGMFEGCQVKKEHLYMGTSIATKNALITSNDTCYFIGKTKNFVFFYHATQQAVQIYPVSEIVSIHFKARTR